MSESTTKLDDAPDPHSEAGGPVPPPPAAAVPPGSGRGAWTRAVAFVRRRRSLARARTLYQVAQNIAALGTPEASARASRLYRRALHLLEPSLLLPRTVSRQALREAVWMRLDQDSIVGWVRRRRRVIEHTVTAIGLLAVLSIVFIPSVRAFVFPPDLAEGKFWATSSAWTGFSNVGIMSDAIVADPMFHTLEERSPYVTLDLGQVLTVHSVEVVNRASCCRERAVPMVIELSADGINFRRVAYRRDTFNRWHARVGPIAARFVRVRVERQSILHLRHISVY